LEVAPVGYVGLASSDCPGARMAPSCCIQPIQLYPPFIKLALGDAHDVDSRDLNSVAGRSYALKLSLVGACARPAVDRLIPLGYLVLYGGMSFGEGLAVSGDEFA
jgi:hypothetical protein